MQTPNTSKSAETDEDAMHAAFQEFMISGGSGGKKKKGGKKKGTIASKIGDSPAAPSPMREQPNKAVSELREHQHFVHEQKIRKQFSQKLNAFQAVLEKDWLEQDDHIGDVVASIANLRERIHVSSKHLHAFSEMANMPGQDPAVAAAQGYGFRTHIPSHYSGSPTVVSHLTKDDLELALSHGLIQHEKMLKVRKSERPFYYLNDHTILMPSNLVFFSLWNCCALFLKGCQGLDGILTSSSRSFGTSLGGNNVASHGS